MYPSSIPTFLLCFEYIRCQKLVVPVQYEVTAAPLTGKSITPRSGDQNDSPTLHLTAPSLRAAGNDWATAYHSVSSSGNGHDAMCDKH